MTVHQHRRDSRFLKISQQLPKIQHGLSTIPERLSNVPEHLRNVPEHLRNVPEHLRNVPEHLRNVPDRVRKAPRGRVITGLVCGGAVAAAAIGGPVTTTLTADHQDRPAVTTTSTADRSATADRASRGQVRTEDGTATIVVPPSSTSPAPSSPASPSPAPTHAALPATVVDLDKAQTANAITIVKVGRQMGVNERGQIIAVATALQESRLYNLDVAVDHDSLGLFQQRPSSGWGTPAQLLDPAYAARAFYQGLLQNKSDWGCLTCAAQRVQVSAYPNAYAKHEAHATAIVHAINAVLH